MQAEQIARSDSPNRKDRLTAAYENLGAVLETVDLTNEQALADAVADAVKATDRARKHADNQ